MHMLTHPALDQLHHTFDQQVSQLLANGIIAQVGLASSVFLDHMAQLKERLAEFEPSAIALEHIPLVIVLNPAVLPAAQSLAQATIQAANGFLSLEADDMKRFQPLPDLALPNTLAYLLVDVDTGYATRNITPTAALTIITEAHRSPLTLHEGVAVLAHYPDAISRNNGFSLLGSRCGDRRVTALWISKGKPKLGWCWAGNPHTWLGSASCAQRISI